MKLRKLTIGLTLTIAAVSIQSAAWSFDPNNPNPVALAKGYQLALQPTTSGGAANQSLDAEFKNDSNTQQPTVLRQSGDSTESAMKSLNVDRYSSTTCQLIPQTSGGTVRKQLDALSRCNSGN